MIQRLISLTLKVCNKHFKGFFFFLIIINIAVILENLKLCSNMILKLNVVYDCKYIWNLNQVNKTLLNTVLLIQLLIYSPFSGVTILHFRYFDS